MQIIGQQLGEVKLYDKAKFLLENGAAILVFRKKNNDLRVMLCTRNFQTANFAGFDARLNSRNTAKTEADGNLIVTDLVVGETRQVNIERIVYSCWFTVAANQEEIEYLHVAYEYIKNQWKNYDDLDPIHQSAFFRSFHFDPSIL